MIGGQQVGLRFSIEQAALAELVPKINAIFRHSLTVFLRDGISPTLLKRKKLMQAGDLALFAAIVAQASAIPELQGRALVRAQFNGIQLADPVDPEEMRRFLDPAESIRLPPKEALKFFKALSPNRRKPLPDDWTARHRRRAFTLAASSDKIVLRRTFGFLKKRLETGDVKRKGLAKLLDSLGVTSNNPQYSEMVVRTNVQDAYNDGYYNEVAEDPDMQAHFPYWEYDAVDDDRVSADHKANERGGVTIGRRPSAFYPRQRRFDEVRGPRVWNCRCSFRWIDKFEAAELGLIGKKAPKKKPPPVPQAKKAIPKPPKIPPRVKPDVGLPKFQTAEEAVQFIRDNYSERVNMKGVSLEEATDIADGLHAALNNTGVVVGKTGFAPKAQRGIAAEYIHDLEDLVKQGKDEIQFGRNYVRGAKLSSKLDREAFKERKSVMVGIAKDGIAGKDKTFQKLGRQRLEELNATDRWSVASTSTRPLKAAAAHAAAHAVYFQGDLEAEWEAALTSNKVTRPDNLNVSEYSGHNFSELYAETVTALAMGQKKRLPKSVLAAYNETMTNYERKLKGAAK